MWIKAFTRAFVSVLFVIILFQFMYEILVRPSDTRIDYWNRSKSYIQEHKPEVILFGSSSGVYAFRHDLMGKAFYNLSFFAEPANFNYAKFLSILENKNNIKAIVIPANYLNLHRWSLEFDRLYYISNFEYIEKSVDVDPNYKKNKYKFIFLNTIKFFFPIINDDERKKLLRKVFEKIEKFYPVNETFEKGLSNCMVLQLPKKGFRKNNPMNNKTNTEQMKMVDQYFQDNIIKRGAYDHRVASIWKKMIKTAQDNNIRVIGVRNPTYKFSYYRKNHKDDLNEKFFKNANYDLMIDNRDIFNDNPEYFNDPTHLSVEGAIVYSQIVEEQIRNYLPKISNEKFNCALLGKKYSKNQNWPFINF
jgi:hypothetical protein